ncbi:MAG TPA: hypothetical protein VFF47_09090 [Nitrospirota bacterium]|nr:hypothetical protein [Nitrospirota bacterium]
MKKIFISIMITTLLILGITEGTNALTFEFNKDKPGVKEFVSKNLRFSTGGENIMSKTPSLVYLMTYPPDNTPVIAYKGTSANLEKIAGGKTAKNIKGPHGEKIFYNPNQPPENKQLSSYTQWDGWVFIGNKKESLQNMLKRFKNPSDVTKTGILTPSFKEWKEGGIRFWGNNSDNHLSEILEAQKSTLLIPAFRNPKDIHAMAGAFTLTPAGNMRGKIMVKPVNQQVYKNIEGDARFISETIRRRLAAVKSPYEGKITSTDGNVVYEVFIGDYAAAQGQIVAGK